VKNTIRTTLKIQGQCTEVRFFSSVVFLIPPGSFFLKTKQNNTTCFKICCIRIF